MQTDTMRLRQLTVRYSVKTDGRCDGLAVVVGRTVVSPRDAASVLVPLLQDEPAEVIVILCLTTKERLIAYHEGSRGTLDSTPAHPPEVFRTAILSNVKAVAPGRRARLPRRFSARSLHVSAS